MSTVAKIGVGVLLGWLALVGIGVVIMAATGELTLSDRPTKAERRSEAQEEMQAEPDVPSDESPLAEEEDLLTEDSADEWCESEEGDELAQLGSEVGRGPSGISDASFARHARQVNQTSDEMLEVAESAPPGAYCAAEELDGLVDYWNQLSGDPDFPNARREAKRVRRFQRENDLTEASY